MEHRLGPERQVLTLHVTPAARPQSTRWDISGIVLLFQGFQDRSRTVAIRFDREHQGPVPERGGSLHSGASRDRGQRCAGVGGGNLLRTLV